MILNCQDWSNNVQSVTKRRQENNIIDCIGPLHVEKKTKVSWSIEQCTIYDEDQTEQRHDLLYKCILHWNQN